MDISVKASRHDFVKALRMLANLKPMEHPEEALVSWEDGGLKVALAGMSVGFPVEGDWPVEVRVPSYFFIGLAKKPPTQDPIEIGLGNGRFKIGTSLVGCTVQTTATPEIPLPLDPTLGQSLRVKFEHDRSSIERAGLAPLVDKAWAETCVRADQAALLLEPFGISGEDILVLIEKRFRKPIGPN